MADPGQQKWPGVHRRQPVDALSDRADPLEQNTSEPGARSDDRPEIPRVELPRGGGALKSIDEKFQVNSSNGTATCSIPLPFSQGRGGFTPNVALAYDSGSGNGVFGIGWNLNQPFIQRRTDKQLPTYDDASERDVFTFSGAEDLVPALIDDKHVTWPADQFIAPTGEQVKRYRPRIDGQFSRIERITPPGSATSYWKVTTASNVVTIYGRSPSARIADPSHSERVYRWLPELSYDDKGQCLEYVYVFEDITKSDGTVTINNTVAERNRLNGLSPIANTYLKQIKYTNKNAYYPDPAQPYNPPAPTDPDYFFIAVLDYGDQDDDTPTTEVQKVWPARLDPFSQFKPGFDVRTYRLCRRILFFHTFTELSDAKLSGPCLVRSLDIGYRFFNNSKATPGELRNIEVDYPISFTQTWYRSNGAGGYDRQSLPPLQVSYQEPNWNLHDVQEITPQELANAPTGLSQGYQFVDLWSEGISGILTEQGSGWFYKTNLGGGAFTPAQPVIPKPSFLGLNDSSLSLQEIEADGRKFIVNTAPPVRGYWEISDQDKWQQFLAFPNAPNVDTRDPNTKYIDLDGDGRPELVISEENVFTWFKSEGVLGWDTPARTPKPFDEERGPALVFADPTGSIFLADMSGDGLTDIVRIRNGEVCYWPNQGYGRFGAKVTMNFPPEFDTMDGFNPALIRLADIDGTGANDIIYLGKSRVRAWLNQAGNAWSQEIDIDPFPTTEIPNQISVVDLLGNGTACVVWSSPLPAHANHPMCYVDLLGGKKPFLINGYQNNCGKLVTWEYKSSTYYYLQDKIAGTPWATKLAFPVQCVSKVSVTDTISRAYLTSQYTYHHGYYDHAEREFRGFGRVEQLDSESFDEFVKSGANVVDQKIYQAPVLTKTWFHTGVFSDESDLLTLYQSEYYKGSSFTEYQLPIHQLDLLPRATAQERQEAARACKGIVIRQEVYGQDDIPNVSNVPYTAAEHNALVNMRQPARNNPYAVFVVTESEAIIYSYERVDGDPRITHTLNTKVDELNNVVESATVMYPRQTAAAGLPAIVVTEQQKQHVTYAVNGYTNDVIATFAYRLRTLCESQSYELTGVTAAAAYFQLSEIANQFASATLIKYEDTPSGAAEKRPLRHARTLFFKDDLSGPLPLKQLQSLGLRYESYDLAFTASLLTSLYQTLVTPALLSEGKYLRSNDYKASGLFPASDHDDEWWTPSGRVQFPASPANAFYMPNQYLDPYGNATTVAYYSSYQLLVQSITDAAGNVNSVDVFDFRLLVPQRIKDANDNSTEARYNLLGMLVGTAVEGKGNEADDFTGFVTDPSSTEIASFFGDPSTYGAALLQNATTCYIYDFSTTPLRVGTVARETHHQQELKTGTPTKLKFSFEYSNGFGKTAMRKVQTKPGLAKQLDASNEVVAVDTTPKLRWIGNGRTVLNNKGNAVKQYLPYFSVTNAYEDDPQLVEIGVSPIVYYDPIGRVVRTDYPEGTFSKTETQAWFVRQYDSNDTVVDSNWYTDRTTGSLATNPQENQAALKAAVHYDTPGVSHLDSMGRAFYLIADNKFIDHTTHAVVEQHYSSYNVLDIESNLLASIDARNNAVVRYGYDQIGTRCHLISMDAGERRSLYDCLGRPLYGWDIKDGNQQVFHTLYDAMHRPTQRKVQIGAAQPIVFENNVYGEGQPSDKALNLRGKIYQRGDQSGLNTSVKYDFKGNLLLSTLELTQDYKNDIDWSSAPLTGEVFTTQTDYDALNRPTRIVAPSSDAAHANVTVPTYNESGRLQTMDAYLRGTAVATHFVTNIDYDEKGQRRRIDYANSTSTIYQYDPLTFRLIALITARNADPQIFWDDPTKVTNPVYAGDVLQYLTYTWDPVGNITFVRDSAQETIYYNNAIIDPSCDYTYDSLYRLVTALGREHIGQNMAPDPFDAARMGNPQPGDGNQMQRYTAQYEYDACGNMTSMKNVGSWNRTFTYAANSNQLLTAPASGDIGTPFTYHYDEHGNLRAMPHLPTMESSFQDQLKHVVRSATSGQETWYRYSSGERNRKIVNKGTRLEERLYLGNWERFRQYNNGNLVLERETLHVVDDKRRIAMVDIPTVQPPEGRETQLIRYQHENHLGSAFVEIDDSAKIISYEEYYPFGSTSYQATDTTREVAAKRYRYTGKERDEESGLYYHGARYYAPWLARWTAVDPTGLRSGLNFYAYCSDNPIAMRDPKGTDGEVCGVYDEDQQVCRTEPCQPASIGPEVPTPAPNSPTAPRPRIRVQPRRLPPPPPPPPPPVHQPPPPPPPVSPIDYTLYINHGVIWNQYTEALREAGESRNSYVARGTLYVLAGLAAPLAGAEEYIGRPLANVPFMVHNAGIKIGEHIGRAYLWSQQGETGEAIVESLEAVKSTSQGIVAGLSWGIPISGAIKSRVVSTTGEAVNQSVNTATGEGTVSVYHGSINNGEQILAKGLEPTRAPTFVSRDLAAAQDALVNHPDAVPGMGTIIESRIPESQFNAVLAPLERPYSGFYPYELQSTEITLRTPEQINLFNQYISK
jgi:RHS repeat-associated protein